jgi:glycosyltransferase involved in cell wall biosynthesis
MPVTPEPNSPTPADVRELQKRLVSAEARCHELEDELRATNELLEQAREKVRAAKRKRIEADHYRSLLHELRSRWYLRPFIPGSKLQPPKDDPADRWLYRGPRFDPPSPASEVEHPRRRILIVGHLLSALLFGSEKSLLEIIAAIDPAKFDVFVAFPERNDQVFANLEPYVQGIAVLDYSWWRKDRPFREETVAVFEEIYRQLAIDLVHANTIMLSDPLVAARRAGIPGITNAREIISLDDGLAAGLGAGSAEIARAVCENATYLLANSATTLADFPCGDRGGFLYNSIDDRALDLSNSVDQNCIEVGMISSNIQKKGVLDFFALARMAGEASLRLRFHLIGPETSLVREWRTSHGELPRNVQIHGYVSLPAAAYGALNIVINLSRFAESFGRTVAEAMVARRPVVAYHHGALPELIDDGETGFLVPYLDLPAVLDRLRFFVEQPAKITEFGEAARQRSLERFSRDIFAERINALYERLIAEARPAR